MTPVLLDCTLRYRRCGGVGDYRYSATFMVEGRTIRVRICRAVDRDVSFTVVEERRDLVWERLWRDTAPAPDPGGDPTGHMERFARRLVDTTRTTGTGPVVRSAGAEPSGAGGVG